MREGLPEPRTLHGGARLPGVPGLPAGQQVLGFQGIETGIFVVLAAVLIGITFWVLKRRDA
jgi:hypothetical protein